MSWIVEESEDTSAVRVHGNEITCIKDGYYGSPINVLYNDAADRNGQYFWQFNFTELDTQSSANPSVGLTTKQGFQSGWGLRAMKYLGNLSDGSSLLVSSFGEPINNNDKVGILLELSDSDLKMYIYHNEKSLGLAFHVQAPYPKPLFPVVSFNSNGKITVLRSQEIPRSLGRSGTQFNGVEGNWKIVNFPSHPECTGCKFEIKALSQNKYHLHARVVNTLNCSLEHNPVNNQWTPSHVMSTMMAGPANEMNKESQINALISGIRRLQVQNGHQLVIETSHGGRIELDRFDVAAPSPVTQNIFN